MKLSAFFAIFMLFAVCVGLGVGAPPPKNDISPKNDIPPKNDSPPKPKPKNDDSPAKNDDSPPKNDDSPPKNDDSPPKNDESPPKNDDSPPKNDPPNQPNVTRTTLPPRGNNPRGL